YILPEVIGTFREHFPKIKIELLISNSKKAMEMVLERQCEIAFIGFDPNHKFLKATPFSSDMIAPIINTSHPLAQNSPLTLKDLQSIPLILRQSGSGTRRAVEQVLNEKGLSWKSFNVALVVGSATAAINAVLSGPFYSFLSLKSVENHFRQHRLVLMHVPDFEPVHRQFFMVRGKRDLLSPMAQHFINHIQTAPTVSTHS
ncbi:MAG: hypothetical protein DSY91_04770, partial [Deltaproteobacteria bacterium]